ncbi:hypothetical protein ACLOJK_002603 [Asimina triloba]
MRPPFLLSHADAAFSFPFLATRGILANYLPDPASISHFRKEAASSVSRKVEDEDYARQSKSVEFARGLRLEAWKLLGMKMELYVSPSIASVDGGGLQCGVQ